ncbi:MAG: signal recognition particle-docking protein FtsY [Alphaproteobacteria bacterium]|jgi:fused signal recognition particle receptor|nr:signal recognition particle-docking protein FtsY [Candidatus Jidaibacter sp.]
MSWFGKLKDKLTKTSSGIKVGISRLVSAKKIDASTLEEFEDMLLQVDLGSVALEISNALSKHKFVTEDFQDEIKHEIKSKLLKKLDGLEANISLVASPTIIMMCGVNGNGKTTTAGKLASKYHTAGKKVMLVACDTFRAAAVDQLKVWAERVGCEFFTGAPNADPASVAYQSIQKAKEEEVEVVLIDTAGRLHNKQNLMDELVKIDRVIKKIDENAPHHTIMVLDATTGQNALMQADTFSKSVKITGIIVTKLDGTAKAGVLIAIADKMKIPIYNIGIGERVEDLDKFNAEQFVNALVGD